MSGNHLIETSWDSQASQGTIGHEDVNPEDEAVVNEEAFLFEEKDAAYKGEMDLDDPACNELLGTDNGEELCAGAEEAAFADVLVSGMDEAQESTFVNDGEHEEPMNEEEIKSDETSENGTAKSERTGVISLAATTSRDSIPEKLEISEQQAAQLKQYVPKFNRGRGRGRDQGREHTLRNPGARPRMGLLQNPQALLGQVIQGLFNQQPRMGFPFPGGPQNRGPFPGGMLNQQGPQNQRGPFMNPRVNAPFSGPQRGAFPGRFPGAPNQRGLFFGGQQPMRPNRLPLGPQPGLPNQRMANPNPFMQRAPLLGQQGIRIPNSGPRPLLGNPAPGGRFIRPGQNSAAAQQGQSFPALMNQVANVLKNSMGAQQMRPPLMMQNNMQQAQQMRPFQGLNRFQHPVGQPPGAPRFPPRIPGPGGAFMNSMIRGNQQQMLNGHGGMMFGNQQMNARFPTPFGAAGIGKPFRMGVPMQQRNAKGFFNHNKPGFTAPMNLAGMKRKATGGDDLPSKIAK